MFIPLSSAQDHFDNFLDEMDRIWEERTQAQGLKQIVKDKVLKNLDKNIFGEVYLENDTPKAIYWAEITTEYYGNITLHGVDDDSCKIIAERAYKEGYFDNKQMEIVQVLDTEVFREFFRSTDCIQNHRQRMALWLEEGMYFPEEEPEIDVEYYRMTPEYKEITATISHAAHQVSRDYYMYPEMNELEKRIELEKRVFDGKFGNLIEPANLLVFHNGEPIGFCVFVEVACWGFEKVPWVFDVVVKPGYDGKGIGRELFKRCLNILTDEKYPIVGLAVTMDNYAKKLYERLEFQPVDEFFEFIRPV